MTTMTTTTGVLPSLSGRRSAVRAALSTVERLMFRGDAMGVARANAWSAVQHDRERARERAEAWAALDDGDQF
jgi:enoyl-CoA hydratase/carnithine racemase